MLNLTESNRSEYPINLSPGVSRYFTDKIIYRGNNAVYSNIIMPRYHRPYYASCLSPCSPVCHSGLISRKKRRKTKNRVNVYLDRSKHAPIFSAKDQRSIGFCVTAR